MPVKHSEQLKIETKRVLDARKWSLRQAERNTNVGFGTIQNMASGKVPSAEMLRRWADAIQEDWGLWLTVSGYETVATANLNRHTGSMSSGEPIYDDPDLNDIHELHGRLLDRIKYLSGAEYQEYVTALRLSQQALLLQVEERLRQADSTG